MGICVTGESVRPRSLYARAGGEVRRRPSLAVGIVVGSLMHAAGHAFVAAAGGVLARALAGGQAPMDPRSTAAFSALAKVCKGDALLALALAGVVAAIAKLVGGVVTSFAEAKLAAQVGAQLRTEVLDDVLAVQTRTRVHEPGHDDHGDPAASAPARAMTALTSHVHEVENGIAHGVLAELRAVVQLAPLAVLLVVVAPSLAASAVVAMLAFGVLAFMLRRALKRSHARAARSAAELVAVADEAVRHAELWATYGAERKIRRHVASVGRTIASRAASLRARAALLSGTSEVLGALALVLVVALVSAGLVVGVDRGTILPFAIAFFMAYRPLRDLVDGRIARARAEESLEAAMRATDREKRAAAPAPTPAGRSWRLDDLDIERLVASHGAHAPLSVCVPAGCIVAIVGPTGIGKTSLLRVLLGLDRARAGVVRWGDLALTDAGVGPAARPFAWVPQHAPVLADTLAANVALGRPDDVAGGAEPILRELGAGPLADSLGDELLGIDREVSGGERQWIAVSRALATDLPVLLLDEPTSALDADAEAALLAALAKLRGKRTIVIVTHRRTPLAIADVIVRLESDESRLHGDADRRAARDAHALGGDELCVDDVRAPSRT